MMPRKSTKIINECRPRLADCGTAEVAARIAELRADDAIQARIDYVADRANEGALTPKEDEEYAAYLQGIDVIAVLQAKARSQSQH